MPKISIITPVYNSEKYLERCILSLINQTLKDIEIILVDDGSTDMSGEICDNFASDDSRIKVVHNENAGMGVSYNTGIKLAKGKYTGFLESDDKAQENMFENLYNLAEKQNLDIAKSAWFSYFSKNDYAEKDTQLVHYNSYNVFNVKTNPNILLAQFSVWSAIYKTDFLKQNNVYYLETPGASYQDVAFSYKAFCLADRISVTPDAYVFYTRDNEASSVNSKKKAEVIFNEYSEADRFFNKYPEIKSVANTAKLIKQYTDYIWNFNRISENLRPEFLKRFAGDFRKYMENGELNEKFYNYVNKDELDFIIQNN